MKKIKTFKNKTVKYKKFNTKRKERVDRQKMYQTTRWRSYRRKFLAKNKYCYACGSEDESMNLDHVRNHKGDSSIFHDTHNIIPLCRSCHSVVTSSFDKHSEQRLKDKAEWLQEMRRQRGLTFAINFVGEI